MIFENEGMGIDFEFALSLYDYFNHMCDVRDSSLWRRKNPNTVSFVVRWLAERTFPPTQP